MPTMVLKLVAFISVMSALSLDDAVASTTLTFREQSDALPKTVRSDRMRAVYLMGLEGVGHHYIRSAIANASRDSPHRITSASAWEYGCQTSMSGNVSRYLQSFHLSREQMQGFTWEEKGLRDGQTMIVYFGKYISYPYLGGSDKVFQYTDLRMLAEAAEEEGVDLRIVYLKRSASDLVIADTIHRDFPNHLGGQTNLSFEERFVEYLKILFTDMSVVHSSLGELDPAFVVCHDYDALGDPSQASRIANFISPNEEMAQLIESSLMDSAHEGHHDANSGLPFEGASVIVDRMQRKLDSFERTYCGH
ncbi:unnamed protein product [Scytosiphon promiscuus]